MSQNGKRKKWAAAEKLRIVLAGMHWRRGGFGLGDHGCPRRQFPGRVAWFRHWSENEIPLPGSCRKEGRRHGQRNGKVSTAATSSSSRPGPAGTRAREKGATLILKTSVPFGWMGCIVRVSITHGGSCSFLCPEISDSARAVRLAEEPRCIFQLCTETSQGLGRLPLHLHHRHNPV
jgi:hypothetical protein